MRPRRTRLAPTLFGARVAFFYVVVLSAYYAAPYVNLFFLLLGFLGLFWALALPWTWRSLAGVSVEGDGSEHELCAGSAGFIDVALTKRGRRAAFDVAVELVLRNGRGERALASGRIGALRGRRRVSVAVPALARGVWSVETARLTSTYPFGVLRRTRAIELGAAFVVHPAPSAVRDAAGSGPRALLDALFGPGASMSAGDALQPAALRDHRDGESLRRVSWRASARRDRLVVQEWDGGGGDGLEVVLDRRAAHEELEEALADLTAIVLIARESKEPLGIRSQDFDRTFGEGRGRWSTALQFLAEAELLPSDAAAPPTASPGVLRLPRPSRNQSPGRAASAPEPKEVDRASA